MPVASLAQGDTSCLIRVVATLLLVWKIPWKIPAGAHSRARAPAADTGDHSKVCEPEYRLDLVRTIQEQLPG
eukprot:14565209-Heterocapsa_arctica.AAC.1